MKGFCIVLALVAVCSADYYECDKDMNLDRLVNDANELHKYMDCYIDETACNALTAAVKVAFVDSLSDACAKCTNTQKHYSRLILEGMKKYFPTKYEDMCKKLDPENKLIPAYLAAVNRY